ncbi:MAG: hypothetical protein HY912_15610 [Desulfomonile tiedjei]|uniref:Uncharacterized protein n=1 Tax=Desulfomonile tiedjei TaxID=2358 RepID=A0A9D6V4Y1_9BACT|nr:hypothetical protein [Desulfomonile tiedjei]
MMNRMLVMMTLFAALALPWLNQAAFGEQLSVSPAVADKAARDAWQVEKKGQVEGDILGQLPGGYRGAGTEARAATRKMEADNKRIENNMRNINNSIRDMNTKINRINSIMRRF